VLNDGWDDEVARIVNNRDFIHPDGWFSLPEEDLIVAKRDFVFRAGVWRGSEVESLWRQSVRERGKSVLVTHSDFHTNAMHSALLRIAGAARVWGTNVDRVGSFARPVPLGLTSPERGSDIHALLSMREPLVDAFSNVARLPALSEHFYVNVSPQTHLSRSRFLSEVERIPGVVIEQADYTESGRLNFLKNLRRFPFVLAPRGNGADTHRLWETLYLGGIPIVLRDRAIEPLLTRLPVVRIRQWSDLGRRSVLADELQRIAGTKWDASHLRMTWWLRFLVGEHREKSRLPGDRR